MQMGSPRPLLTQSIPGRSRSFSSEWAKNCGKNDYSEYGRYEHCAYDISASRFSHGHINFIVFALWINWRDVVDVDSVPSSSATFIAADHQEAVVRLLRRFKRDLKSDSLIRSKRKPTPRKLRHYICPLPSRENSTYRPVQIRKVRCGRASQHRASGNAFIARGRSCAQCQPVPTSNTRVQRVALLKPSEYACSQAKIVPKECDRKPRGESRRLRLRESERREPPA